jgi:hypothetical protein
MDRHRSGRTLTALGLIVPALLLGPAPAGAHAMGPRLLQLHAHEVAHSAGPAALPHAGALLVLGAALLAGLGWWRRAGSRARGGAVAIALSLVLTVFTLETAVHSVHHLTGPGSGADCPVLSGSQHLAWGTGDLTGIDAPPLDVTTATPIRPADGPRWQICRPSPGRAPPA